MASTQTNTYASDVADGDDGSATQYNNARKDHRLGVRDRRINDDGATVTFDLSLTNVHEVTLAGMHFRIEIIQDATGSRIPTWFSTINWVNNTTPTLTTTPGRKDSFIFYCKEDTTSGSAFKFDGYIGGLNIVA
jgi:hypothetical protein